MKVLISTSISRAVFEQWVPSLFISFQFCFVGLDMLRHWQANLHLGGGASLLSNDLYEKDYFGNRQQIFRPPLRVIQHWTEALVGADSTQRPAVVHCKLLSVQMAATLSNDLLSWSFFCLTDFLNIFRALNSWKCFSGLPPKSLLDFKLRPGWVLGHKVL